MTQTATETKCDKAATFAEYRQLNTMISTARAALTDLETAQGELVDKIVKDHGGGPYKMDGELVRARKFRNQKHFTFAAISLDGAEEV